MTTAALAETSIGSSLVGGILQGKSQQQQFQAQSEQYAYQSQVAVINSNIDKQNADYALNQGEQQAVIAGMKGAQTLGAIKTNQAASGFDVNTGSNKDVQGSQKTITAMNLEQIRANASKQAYDYNVQSTQDINQAGLYSMASANAASAGTMAMEASLVSTAGSVSSKWLQATQSGALPALSIG